MLDTEDTINQWHLDKRIPIALIFAVMMQTGAGVWWAASMAARIEHNELRMARLEASELKVHELTSRFDRTLSAIEQGLADTRRSLERIERRIDARPALTP